MTIQDLLKFNNVDITKVVFFRHPISNKEVRINVERGTLDEYQSSQSNIAFRGFDYLVSFLGKRGTEATLVGVYKIKDTEGYLLQRSEITSNVFFYDGANPLRMYNLEKTDILSEFNDRLVIEWGGSTVSWRQRATDKKGTPNNKDVLYIAPKISSLDFIGYDKVVLSYAELQIIFKNPKDYEEWEKRLSSVAGVYLINDTKTGKNYVGSASSEDNGIWGRWSDYAKNGHGGNEKLKKVWDNDNDYCKNYRFSILEVFPIKRDKRDILKCEYLYMEKLSTRTHGYN